MMLIGSHGLPSDEIEVMMLLDELSTPFIKDFRYGLGFVKDFWPLIYSIEELTDASTLTISDRRDTGLVDNNRTFAISFEDFDDVRKLINRITNNGRNAMRTVKITSVHNVFAKKLGLPEKAIEFGRSSLRRNFTRVAMDGQAILSKAEQAELIDAVSKQAKSIVEDQPDRLVGLQRDFELVTLDNLIQRFEGMFEKALPEEQWQEFLNKNRFLLAMGFGYPVIIVKEEASVGGHKLSGSGEKVTDFLVKNALTDNVGIIEIKKPTTRLVNKTEYRGEVFAASTELSGGINQVIDQKHNLVSRFAQKKEDSGIYDIESYAVKCCLIIGKIPEHETQRKSFEYIQGNSKDVEIITFDELLAKLKTIKEFLEDEQVESAPITLTIKPPW